MAGFALGSDASRVVTILAVLGLVGSLIWLFVGHRSVVVAGYYWDRVRECEADLPDAERVYTNAQDWRAKTRPPIFGVAVSSYLAYAFPALWAATWVFALALRP
jgi:hypothetical protein